METVPFCAGPEWKPYEGVCGACGDAIWGGRSKWFCSTGRRCAVQFSFEWRGHDGEHLVGFELGATLRWRSLSRYRYMQDIWPCRDIYLHNHYWPYAREAAVKRDKGKCVKCGGTRNLQVNHIVPRNRQGYGPGCWHHQDGLESLCSGCHGVVTGQQVRMRNLARVGQTNFLQEPT